LKAYANQVLGLSFTEISDTTPVEFEELCEQYLIGRDLDNVRFGQICAVLANLKRDPDKRSDPWTPFDFFPRMYNPIDIQEEQAEGDERNRAIILDLFYEDIKTRTRIKRRKLL